MNVSNANAADLLLAIGLNPDVEQAPLPLDAFSALVTSALQRHLDCRSPALETGGSIEKLDVWLQDARLSGVYAMQRFARAARQDIDALRNAVLEPWSNGQTEGEINRLKAIKRAMYGRAGVELLRARMIPLYQDDLHQE